MSLAILPLLLALGADAPPLNAGAAAVVITPPEGTPMAGYYSARAAEGVHDDLHAKALVLQVGETKAALVALDLISTPPDLVADARRAIGESTGVPPENVMISATHAHTGPILAGRNARDDVSGGKSDLAVQYREALPGKIAEAVRKAEAALVPAKIKVARGSESSIAFNRRFHMADGSVGWNPGKLNPNIVKPAGTIDPDVPVVYIESADGKPIATYINHAVHLDNVGGPFISADMPATVARCLADVKGPEMVTMFTAGCCGDVNHINVRWAEAQHGFANAARMGVILAAEVLRTWPELEPVEPSALRVARATVKLPLAEFSEEDLSNAREVAARKADPDSPPPPFLEQVQAFKVLDVEARHGKAWEVEVQVIALGDQVAFVSLPGEIFVELGLEIKQDSPYTLTILAELANGSVGYVPSRRAYPQGNYEVISARCAQGSGEAIVEAAVDLLKQLHREATGH